MPTISTDCHITLAHADINGGDPYGFILQRSENENNPPVIIQRKVTSDGEVSINCYFTVLLSDDLINPDGSQHSNTRSAMYALLMDYLAELEGVTLSSPIGSIADIGATGHSATETHFAGFSLVACQLTNAGVYYGPVDLEAFSNSVWDGTLTWSTSYWR
mgnify:CR=1 FL=1|jgi:hypothetical protein